MNYGHYMKCVWAILWQSIDPWFCVCVCVPDGVCVAMGCEQQQATVIESSSEPLSLTIRQR